MKKNKRIQRFFPVAILCGVIFLWCFVAFAMYEYEKEPIKNTQSETVLVTDELLTREGESQPASPTFLMPDLGTFMIRNPFQPEDAFLEITSEEDHVEDWNDWFQWEEAEITTETEQTMEVLAKN